jgi:nucleoside-diphosphate-sugar epimerase
MGEQLHGGIVHSRQKGLCFSYPYDGEARTMSILVTGATGFIGGNLCAKLAREGSSVRALVRDDNRAELLRQQGIEIAHGDLLDPDTLRQATSGIRTVYHFAAVFRQEVPSKEIWATNVTGIENLLDAAARSGVKRFIHCSSTSVYGLFPRTPTTEASPFVPIRGDLYQASKLAAEQLVSEYGSAGKLGTTIFRTTGVYGEGDLRFLKLFKAIARRRFMMIGRGEVPFSMIHIDDLLDGVMRCATLDQAINNHYLLTGNDPISLNETVRIIAKAAGVPAPRLHVPVMPIYYAGLLMELTLKPLGISPPLYRRRVNFFRITRGFDSTKAKRELGFNPKLDLATGARRVLKWYRSRGLL